MWYSFVNNLAPTLNLRGGGDGGTVDGKREAVNFG